MINLISITFSNLLSYGEQPTTIDFTKSNQILLTGNNGNGKSSIIDAICFALYGKPYRHINIPQLINSINKKGTSTKVTFKINDDIYELTRSLRPNHLSLSKNGEDVPEPPHQRDFQQWIEQEIYHLDQKTFLQNSIIGSTAHTPFLKLPKQQRREMIENLFNLQIIQAMKEEAKHLLKDAENTLTSHQGQRAIHQASLQTHKQQRQKLKKVDELIKQRQYKAEDLQKELTEHQLNLLSKEQREGVRTLERKLNRKMMKADGDKRLIHQKIKDLQKRQNFFLNTLTCPTCGNSITEHQQQEILKKINERLDKGEKATQEIEEYIGTIEDEINGLKMTIKGDEDEQREVDKREHILQQITKEIHDLQSYKNENLQEIEQQIEEIQQKIDEVVLHEEQTTKDIQVLKKVLLTLQDDAAKEVIIRESLNELNAIIALYMEEFDFNIGLTIDNDYDALIKSRYRDNFQYDSLSDGEKARVDIATMFAFREFSLKHSKEAFDIVILDEVDKAMDMEGAMNLKRCLEGRESRRKTLVVSHKDTLVMTYDRVMVVEKVKGFSHMREC